MGERERDSARARVCVCVPEQTRSSEKIALHPGHEREAVHLATQSKFATQPEGNSTARRGVEEARATRALRRYLQRDTREETMPVVERSGSR